MISSRFRVFRIIPLIMVYISVFVFVFEVNSPALSGPIALIVLILSIFCAICLLVSLIAELKGTFIKVIIKDELLCKTSFFGLGIKSVVYLNEIDGYSIGSLVVKGGRVFETFVLIQGKHKILKLSEYYHANYYELKYAIIDEGIKDLGTLNKNFIGDTIEMFKQ